MTADDIRMFATGPKSQRGGVAIVKANSDLTDVLLELHTFAAGNVTVTWLNGNTVQVTVPAGQCIILGPITRVASTGTSLANTDMLGYV